MSLIQRIASDEVIEQAFAWLCEKRQHYHYNADVWQVRRWWQEKKVLVQAQLRAGTYQFRELRLIRGKERVTEMWASLDALVLKAIAIVLTAHLKPHLSDRCFHLAGTGGGKAAVREVAARLEENTFVFRTDVKGYYASINQEILFDLVQQYVKEPLVLDLIRGYLQRFVSDGGVYEDITKGISLGCPLSPLMGALYLKPLDDCMAKLGVFYARFMDDWVILAPTRWKLRGAIKAVKEMMGELKLELHPDKTFIGRISHGFDFLGYWFSPAGLEIAPKTVERFVERVSRLYEQGADFDHIGEYVRHWRRWVRSGVDALRLNGVCIVSLLGLVQLANSNVLGMRE